MKKAFVLLFILFLPIVMFAQATSNSTPFTVTVPQTVPTLGTCAPNSANMGAAPVTMTCTGTNFVSASKVFFDSTALTTTFVSATQVTAVIPTSLLTVTAGQTSQQHAITVQNPVTVALTWQDLVNPVGTQYNVYRNGAKLTSNPLASRSYDDIGVPHGSFTWGITSVSGSAESAPATVSLNL